MVRTDTLCSFPRDRQLSSCSYSQLQAWLLRRHAPAVSTKSSLMLVSHKASDVHFLSRSVVFRCSAPPALASPCRFCSAHLHRCQTTSETDVIVQAEPEQEQRTLDRLSLRVAGGTGEQGKRIAAQPVAECSRWERLQENSCVFHGELIAQVQTAKESAAKGSRKGIKGCIFATNCFLCRSKAANCLRISVTCGVSAFSLSL